jgi:hypothetical protein
MTVKIISKNDEDIHKNAFAYGRSCKLDLVTIRADAATRRYLCDAYMQLGERDKTIAAIKLLLKLIRVMKLRKWR